MTDSIMDLRTLVEKTSEPLRLDDTCSWQIIIRVQTIIAEAGNRIRRFREFELGKLEKLLQDRRDDPTFRLSLVPAPIGIREHPSEASSNYLHPFWMGLEPRPPHAHRILPRGRTPTVAGVIEGREIHAPSPIISCCWRGRDGLDERLPTARARFSLEPKTSALGRPKRAKFGE